MLKTFATAAVIVAVVAGAMPIRADQIPSGTEIKIRLENEVAPDSKRGDTFSAVLDYPVFVDGKEMLPAGTRIEGDVRGNKKKLVLSPRNITLPGGQKVPFNAAVSDITGKKLKAEEKEGAVSQSGSKADAARQAAEIGAMGGMIGVMTTGTAKGMGVGAAAGAAAVLIGRGIAGRHHGTVIPAGTQLTLNLSRSLEIPDNAAQTAATPGSNDSDRPVLRRNP